MDSTTGRGTGSRRGRPRRGSGPTAIVDGRSIALTRCGGGSARWRTTARTRAARWGRARSRRAAALPVARLRLRPRHRGAAGGAEHLDDWCRRTTSRSVPTASRSGCPTRSRPRTVADVLVETLVAHGVDTVFGMVGHSNLGFADALRRAEERGELRFIGIRHEGAAAFAASAYGKLTGRPAACFAIAGAGLDQPAHRPVRRQARRRAGRGRSPARCRRRCWAAALPGPRPRRGLPRRRHLDGHGAVRQRPRRAGGPGGEARPRRPRRRASGAARRGAGTALAGRGRLPDGATRAGRSGPDADALARATELRRRARRPVLIVGHGPAAPATRSWRWPSGSVRRCSRRSRPRA